VKSDVHGWTFNLIRQLIASETFGERFVTKILGRELGL
jgi:hypothetical protein